MSRAGHTGTGFRDGVEAVDAAGVAVARLGADYSVIPYMFSDQIDVDMISMGSGGVGGTNPDDPFVMLHDGVVKQKNAYVDANPVDTSPTELFEIPAGSFILGVRALVITPFDGDATQTLTVGTVGGTGTEFIHGTDFDPSAAADTVAMSLGGTNNSVDTLFFTHDAIDLEAVWVNTDNETAGLVLVTAWYI